MLGNPKGRSPVVKGGVNTPTAKLLSYSRAGHDWPLLHSGRYAQSDAFAAGWR